MADMPQQVQLLSDILGRPVRAFRLGSASALGTALLSGAVDRERYSAKTRPRAFKPSERAMRYNEIYANYVAQFPAGESGSRL